MKQPRLDPGTPRTLLSLAARHDENNLRSAREIIAAPQHFGGPDSALVKWANDVIERLGNRDAKGE